MSFVEKLNRVGRVAGIYVLCFFLLMQVIEVVLDVPMEEMADSRAVRALFVVMAIGFPVTLVLSWFFPQISEGLTRKLEVDQSEQNAAVNKVAVGNTTVFISYRRKDNSYAANLVYDRVAAVFGRGSVYFDVDAVPAGIDFRQHIQHAVEQCDVMLVIIGENWLERDSNGESRLENPADYVRIEIETALRRGIPVIPVPVGNARLPREDELPEEIGEFAFRNAREIRTGSAFQGQMERLIRSIRELTPDARSS